MSYYILNKAVFIHIYGTALRRTKAEAVSALLETDKLVVIVRFFRNSERMTVKYIRQTVL